RDRQADGFFTTTLLTILVAYKNVRRDNRFREGKSVMFSNGMRLVGAALGVAVAWGAPAVAQEATEIVVYNAQHESLTEAWVAGFTAETGIKVVIRNGGDTEFGNQIVVEGANSPADVFLTENSPAMALVDKAGLFAPVD